MSGNQEDFKKQIQVSDGKYLTFSEMTEVEEKLKKKDAKQVSSVEFQSLWPKLTGSNPCENHHSE